MGCILIFSELLIQNVFDQLCKEAIPVSQNQTASTIVEQLLHEAKPSQLLSFMNALAADWETSCTDRFASHVTQTLLTQMMPYMNHGVQQMTEKETQNSDDEDDEGKQTPVLRSAKSLFIELYSLLMSNLSVYMQHTYASHILRVIMEVLASTRVSEGVIKSKMSRRQGKGELRIRNVCLLESFIHHVHEHLEH